MIPVRQTNFGDRANSFSACIASILELPLDQVPPFKSPNDDSSWSQFQEWLLVRSFFALQVHYESPIQVSWLPPCAFLIFCGKNPAGEEHSIVASGTGDVSGGVLGYVPVHDPHPNGAFLVRGLPKSLIVIASLVPKFSGVK